MRTITLGKLIDELEKANKNLHPQIGFGDIMVEGLDSWRGDYGELALSYGFFNYDDPMTVGKLLSLCLDAVGKSFEGYKGGDYTMCLETNVWVDNYGKYSETAISHIDVDSHTFFINTKV